MARPKHTAFLDLEETLAHRLRNAWSRYWGKVSAEIVTLCSLGQFDAAHRVAESIDLAPLFDRSRIFARTVGMSALLLGASRITAPRKSVVAKQPPKRELDAFLRQTETMLARNASQALRQMAHEWVNQEEATLLKAEWREEDHPRDARGRFTDVLRGPDGQPLVLYHGYRRGGVELDVDHEVAGTGEIGAYFTPQESEARRYGRGEDGGLLTAYVAMRNPYIATTKPGPPGQKFGHFTRAARDALIAQGYDGVITKPNGVDIEEVVPFYRNQIHLMKGDYPGHPFRGNQYVDAGVSMKFDAEVRGNVTFNHILLGGQKVGHISGFVEQDKFRIYRTEIDKAQRGSGAYRAAVQQVANKYGGAFTYADEASPQLQASLKKLPTYEWTDFGGRSALLIHPEIEKADWREEDHPRGKTTPESTPGSFISVTGTSEFKAWFSGSKVVNAAGAPLRVYHGTPYEFTTFAPGRGGGIYFTDVPELASGFAGGPAFNEQGQYVPPKPNVVPVYLSIKNPLVLGKDWVSRNMEAGEFDWDELDALVDSVGREGVYDGVIVRGVPEGKVTADQYIIFDPSKIKSALTKVEKAGVAKLDTGADRNQVKINVAGKNYFGLAASIQVSRMSAFGFLLEAAESGLTNYRVDAVLDERTCEVCRHMDGWVFPVEAGLQLAQQIMDTEDPEALKALAPFYAQNKASLAALGGYGTEDFINEGMSLPPYHPLCRCILTPTDEPADVHPTQIEDRVALASQTLYGEGDGVRLTRDLFGIEQPTPQDRRSIGDVVPDTELEELDVAPWLDRLTTEPTPEKPPVAPEQVHEWMQELLHDWLAQPAAAVPPDALVTPTPFEGTTIPQEYVRQFQPSRLAQLAQARWPWLAGLFGWLALEPDRPLFEDDSALVAEEELADEERDERDELREDRRP